MDVFNVPAVEVSSCFLLDCRSFPQQQTALFLLDLYISEGHLFMELLDTILDLKDFALALLLSL
jgi:hypothetical protein